MFFVFADLTSGRMPTKTLKMSSRFGDLSKYLSAVERINLISDSSGFGADAEKIHKLIGENSSLAEKLHENLPYRAAEIVWAVRFEMAQTLEDVLARRTRVLFLDAKAAIEIAPNTAEIMAAELGKDRIWIDGQIKNFIEIAKGYLPL